MQAICSVPLSLSGSHAVIGAKGDALHGSNAGAAYILERGNDGIWTEVQEVYGMAAGDFAGSSVSVSGDYAFVGAFGEDWMATPDVGAVHVFERSASAWVEMTTLRSSDHADQDYFGFSAAVSGNYAIVGAPGKDDNGDGSGSAYLMERDSVGGWAEKQKLLPSDGATGDSFGQAVSVSGDIAVVGAYKDSDNGIYSGSAYIFERTDGIWLEKQKLLASDGAIGEAFGSAVSISGNYAAIGAPYHIERGMAGSGSVYVFERGTDGTWTEESKLTSSDIADGDWFGSSVSVSGDAIVIGAQKDNDRGSAYLFRPDSGGTWAEIQKFVAADVAAGDRFGSSVAVSGDTALIGAHLADGVNADSGAAYFFDFGLSVAENSPTDTYVGTLSGLDIDDGEIYTFALLDDAGGRFKISGNELLVADGSLLDYEDATSHDIVVGVTDSGGKAYDKTITIFLTDVNEATTVASITRRDGSPISASSVSWSVTFAGDVSNLSAANFELVNAGLGGTPAITDVTGSGMTWTVTSSTGSGDGTLQLNMVNDTGLIPTLGNLPFDGEAYIIDKTAPTVTSVTSSAADGIYKAGASIAIAINFTERVSSSGLTLQLNSGGTLTTGAFSNVLGWKGIYIVAAGQNSPDLTVSSLTATITDALGNATTDPTIPVGQNIADTKDIVIDTTKPVTTAVPVGGIYSTPVAVELTCNDGTGSGCLKTVYCLAENCATWKLYTVPIELSGQRYLSYRSLDNAGNWETPVTNINYTMCTYIVTPRTLTIVSGASTGDFTVTTQDGCNWSSSSSQPWLTAASTGTGSGTGSYAAGANPGPLSLERTAAITIAGKTITVTQKPVKPAVPEITSAIAGATDVELQWTDNSDNEKGFRIYRRKSTETAWTEAGTELAGATTYTDTAETNTTYYYKISAYNSGGASDSAEEKITTGNITPPELLTAEALTDTTSELYWRAFENGEEGYEIWRTKKAEGGWTKITASPLALGISKHTDTALTEKALNLYQICAITTAGGSACSNEMMINGPTGLTLTPTAGGVQLDWTDNSADESGFRIFRKGNTEQTWPSIGSAAAEAETYLDDTVATDTTYSYRISAYNESGSKAGNSAKTATGTLVPPDGLIAVESATGTRADLSWQDNSTGETGYELWRLRPLDTEWMLVKVLGADTTACLSGLSAGKLYLHKVCAVTAGGGRACSNLAGVNGPTDVTAAAAAGGVDLSWTDNSINEAGFNIWRKTPATSWVLIGRTGADITTYQDRTVEAGEYLYRICTHGLTICETSGTVTFPPAP